MIIWYCKEPTSELIIYCSLYRKCTGLVCVSASRPVKRQRKIIRRSSSTSDHNNITIIIARVIQNKCIIINIVTATAYTNDHLYRGHYIICSTVAFAPLTRLLCTTFPSEVSSINLFFTHVGVRLCLPSYI